MSTSTLSSLLSTLTTKADSTFLTLARILSTSTGIEATTRTLYYTLLLLHSQLHLALNRQYERIALTLVSQASKQLLPGETVVASIEPPQTRLSRTTLAVRSLADAAGATRVFSRLWRLVGIYELARTTAEKPARDPIIKTLVWAKIGSEVGFQVLENTAFLLSKGVGGVDEKREARLWVWGYRFWAASTVFEVLRLARIRQLRFREEFGAQGKGVSAQSLAVERRWWRDLGVFAPWVPVTVHWSLERGGSGLLGEGWVGLFGAMSGVAMLRDMWS